MYLNNQCFSKYLDSSVISSDSADNLNSNRSVMRRPTISSNRSVSPWPLNNLSRSMTPWGSANSTRSVTPKPSNNSNRLVTPRLQNFLNIPGTSSSIVQPADDDISMTSHNANNSVTTPTSQSKGSSNKDEGMKTNFTIIVLFVTSVYGVFKTDTETGNGKCL